MIFVGRTLTKSTIKNLKTILHLSICLAIFLCFYKFRDYNIRISWLKLKKLTSRACEIPPLSHLEMFYDYGKKEKYKCKLLKKVGGNAEGDGSKFVCFDKPFDIVGENCIVLSFGIGGDWSFEDAMSNLGCTVYAFDPTISKKDFDRNSKIHFFNLGLSNFRGKAKLGNKINCEVDRYENIVRRLNLTEKKIDYLKMDIEGSEEKFFQDIFSTSSHLLENIKQIGIEVHSYYPPRMVKSLILEKSLISKLWNYMHELECRDFKLLHHEPNLAPVNVIHFNNRTVSSCYEVVWVKV